MNSVMNTMSSYPFTGSHQSGLTGLSRGYGPTSGPTPPSNMNPKTSFAIQELLGLSSSVGQPQGFPSSQLGFCQEPANTMATHHHYAYPHQNYSSGAPGVGCPASVAGPTSGPQPLGGSSDHELQGMAAAAVYNASPWRSAGFFSSLGGAPVSCRDDTMLHSSSTTAIASGMSHVPNTSVTPPRGFAPDPMMSPDKHNMYHQHPDGKI